MVIEEREKEIRRENPKERNDMEITHACIHTSLYSIELHNKYPKYTLNQKIDTNLKRYVG